MQAWFNLRINTPLSLAVCCKATAWCIKLELELMEALKMTKLYSLVGAGGPAVFSSNKLKELERLS